MEDKTSSVSTEKTAGDITQKSRKEEIDSILEKICNSNKLWLWFIFMLTSSPGVLNGMHMMSYIFFVNNEPPYCSIPPLEKAGWTSEQIKNISLPKSESPFSYGCTYYDYNYSKMANKSFNSSVMYVNSVKEKPKLLPCTDYKFENTYSVISEWNLVCDRFYYRSNIQAAYAVGKFFGASFFGIIADKYGRKCGFTVAASCFAVSAILAAFSGTLGVFLVVRFFIGFGGVGCYGTAYTLLSELVVGSAKTWMCCTFNISYAIGMLILSYLAYRVQYWKTLLIVMSIPTILLPFYYWLLPESPQWLLSRNRYSDAWKILQKIDLNLQPLVEVPKTFHKFTNANNNKIPMLKKLMLPLIQFSSIFSTRELTIRSLICFFVWFTVSSSYMGLAMDAENLTVDRYIFMTLNGVLEIFSYLLPAPLLLICGRRTASILLFSLTGLLLISIMFLSKALQITILLLALFGRFFSTSAYVIFALYTSELFPTAIRNTAIGASLSMSHFGTFVSPYIVDILGVYLWYLPSTIFGLFSICSIFLLMLLPETKNRPLYNTVEEMTILKRKN